jgi:sugar phosphate isomerase/epimerase
MKLSVQTGGTFEALGVDAGFAAIKAAGFDTVDLGLDFPYKWDDLVSGKKTDFYDDEKFLPYVNEIKAAAGKYGIEFGQVHAPFPIFVPRSPEGSKNVREDIEKCIKITGELGCPYIIIHPGYDGSARYPSMTKEQEYKMNIDYYTSIIPLLKEYRVVCCLENMWMNDWKSKKIYTACCSDINETIKYIDELNAVAGERLFGFCLDIGHLLLLGQDPCNWIEKLGDRLVTLHVHDNGGVNDDHISPYLGVCNWDRFILGLRKIGYKGVLNLETFGFNKKFPKELVPSVLKMLGDIGKYLIGRIEAQTDPMDEYR